MAGLALGYATSRMRWLVFVAVPDANALQKAMAEWNISIRGAYGVANNYSRVSTASWKMSPVTLLPFRR
ncbi:hypothetical protein GRI97_02310 [Altererythrobacter xixiisoli]|uniref:Uncharacterized protein n=1 Tax=Croceibacterium xixiisoli TaxID=1476466 RepID=A0A6I4TRR4_9SPHN|nr:hypothetical protein [Croceibacterium xixiisoli]MXO97820.1 hypothetical protein [Croceibacterium xixiisoli]